MLKKFSVASALMALIFSVCIFGCHEHSNQDAPNGGDVIVAAPSQPSFQGPSPSSSGQIISTSNSGNIISSGSILIGSGDGFAGVFTGSVDVPADYSATINDDQSIVSAIMAAQDGTLPETAQNRVVWSGINKFADGNNLNGCIRDSWRRPVFLVRHYHIKPSEIRIFNDEQVQKNQMIKAWTWARKAPLHWEVGHSGHGAQWPSDIPGEPASVQRVICMQNFAWTRETCISNQEVKVVFGQAPPPSATTNVGTVWFDTCFSGNIDRAESHTHSNNIVTKSKEEIPPPEIKAKIDRIIRAGGKRELMRDSIHASITFFEACGPNQTSADSQDDKGLPVGAGTMYGLRRQEFELNTPTSIFIKDVDADLARDGYDQIPQIEGVSDKPFWR